jgi:hypothetical protein
MSVFRRVLGVTLLLTLVAITGEAQVRTETQNNSQAVRQLLRQIEDRIDLLRNSLGTNNRSENTSALLTELQTEVQRFRQQVNRRQASASDAQQVLDRASALDSALGRRNQGRTQQYWSSLNTDLNELARIYGLTWSTNTGGESPRPGTRPTGLTGTYRLDPTQSQDPAAVIDRALRSVPYQERQQRREQLVRRLQSPDEIAIDVRGRSVTLASTRAPQISFEADGREQAETTPSGRTIRLRSTLSGNQLTITTIGDRDTEFNVIFAPIGYNGQRLRVTRRVYAANMTTPIEIQSFYERTSDTANLDIYSGPRENPRGENTDDFLLRNGETVVAELDNPLTTQTSRDGETFTATIRSPSQYAGAKIEGHVSSVKRSGRVTGRSELTFSFDRIRLRNGQTHRFAGILESVRTPNGELAKIDTEGAVQEDSQSTKTIERTAIGTAIGAIIGAVAGGGKGAAIGAVIGAGGGAGSVYVQGRDDLDLPRGTELTIRTTGPNR